MDDDSSQDYLWRRDCLLMKLSRQLKWHTANLASEAQTHTKMQLNVVKASAPRAHTKCAGTT